MKATSILSNVQFSDVKPVVTLLMETQFTKEIRIALKEGQIMAEHKTSFPIIIEIVEGQIYLGVENDGYILDKGDLITLEANVSHDLRAQINTIIRLSLTYKDKKERVEELVNAEEK